MNCGIRAIDRISNLSLNFSPAALIPVMAVIPDPKQENRPQPLTIPMLVLFSICSLSIIFILWRRAHNVRRIISMRLKSITGQEGNIRLDADDGPTYTEFLHDDYDADAQLEDDGPLSERARGAHEESTRVWAEARVKDSPTLRVEEEPRP